MSKQKYEKVCAECGKIFHASRHQTKWCSRECKNLDRARKYRTHYKKNVEYYREWRKEKNQRRRELTEAMHTNIQITDPMPCGMVLAEAWEFGLAIGIQ